MHYLAKTIRGLTTITRWGAVITIFLMMVIIAFTVIARGVFNTPIVGDYELVQLMMVILVGLGVAYTESIDAHVKVGLLVDRFNRKAQAVIDVFVYLLVAGICFIVGTILLKAGIKALTTFLVSTSILHIPHYPFQFLLSIGFFLWGLEAVLKVVFKVIELFTGKVSQQVGSDINVS
jgi:TRAP-type transport system small permease protein